MNKTVSHTMNWYGLNNKLQASLRIHSFVPKVAGRIIRTVCNIHTRMHSKHPKHAPLTYHHTMHSAFIEFHMSFTRRQTSLTKCLKYQPSNPPAVQWSLQLLHWSNF